MVSFIAEREELLRAGYLVKAVVDEKSRIPILGHLLVEADLGNRVSFTASNIDVAAVAYAKAEVSSAGSIAVPAIPFAKSIRASIGADADFSASHATAFVTIGKSKFTLNASPGADFPALEMIGKEAECKFDAPAGFFAGIRERHGYIIDQHDIRPPLLGVGMAAGDGKLTFSSGATAGGSRSQIDCPTGAENMPDIIIPQISLDWIVDFEGKKGAKVEVSESFIRVSTDAGMICSRLIDAQFPDLSRLISARRLSAKVDRHELVKAIERAEIYADDRCRAIRLAFKPEHLLVETSEGANGGAASTIAADCDFNFEIGFAAKPLRAALESFKGETVDIAIGENMQASLITSDAEPGRCSMAMPYAIRSQMREAA